MSWRSVCLLGACLALLRGVAGRRRPATAAELRWLDELDVNHLVQKEYIIDRNNVDKLDPRDPSQPGASRPSARPKGRGSGEEAAKEAAQVQETYSWRHKDNKDPGEKGKWDYLEKQGISMNDKGDLKIFLANFATNFCAFLACGVFFSFARKRWPQMYANNVRSFEEGGFQCAPFTPSDNWLGWIPAGLFITVEQVKNSAGLDAALLVEFSGFAMRLLVAVGAPLIIILSPIHLWCGGEDADSLSRLGLNNVKQGRAWLFDIHSFLVWYVVLVTERFVWLAMRRFLNMRYEWLVKLSPPRSTTLLVEGLPENLRTDQALGDYFRKYFTESSVECAYVVKNTDRLKPLYEELNAKKLALEKALFLENSKREQRNEATDPAEKRMLTEELTDTEHHRESLEGEVNLLDEEVSAERQRIIEDSQLPLEADKNDEGEEIQVLSQRAREICAPSGFVTFATEREALLALYARSAADSEEMILSVPPSPCDVRYDDLQTTPLVRKIKNVLGTGAIFGIFVGYTPFIALISCITQMSVLEKVPIIAQIIRASPSFGILLQGFFSTAAIVLFMGFLPSILMWIFRTFFTLKADAWAQQRLQVSYFWFLVCFILLITAVGKSLVAQIKHVIDQPTDITVMLATSLPNATHFYLNYLVMQWVVHGMNLTRYIQLLKYFAYRNVVGEARAVELSEPEDQDYYGMGARSARWTLDLILALVFCSITPLMTFVAFFNFLITRVVYGYLTAFAETRKSDSGGPFFVEQMRQIQFGLVIYICLMTGLFAQRAETWFPAWVAGLSLLPVFFCYRRIDGLVWDSLPVERVITSSFQANSVVRHRSYASKGASRARYIQPEMLGEEEWKDMMVDNFRSEHEGNENAAM